MTIEIDPLTGSPIVVESNKDKSVIDNPSHLHTSNDFVAGNDESKVDVKELKRDIAEHFDYGVNTPALLDPNEIIDVVKHSDERAATAIGHVHSELTDDVLLRRVNEEKRINEPGKEVSGLPAVNEPGKLLAQIQGGMGSSAPNDLLGVRDVNTKDFKSTGANAEVARTIIEQRQIKAVKLNKIQAILNEYNGLESNIPVNHEYWTLLNEYRNL